MNIRSLSLISLLLYSTFSICVTETQDPDFCGNKHKNLVRLKSIVHGMPGVAIPEFIERGISPKRVEAFLKQHAPDIYNDYELAINLLQPKASRSIFRNIFQVFTRTPTIKVEDLLARIQEKIKTCFKNKSFDFLADEKALFDATAEKKQFFMVRSNGIEDGAIANAGGNVSIAYVRPDQYAIAEAMGQVVASYFSMQSLKNRIGGGEQLSSSELLLSVLIQVLIGEEFDGSTDVAAIPISGVAYTTNQSLSSPNFAVAEINASYGHGEGVVANRVTADRYYVTASRTQKDGISIYPMLYYKEERLVPHTTPSNAHTLITLKNDPALAGKSALSRDQVKHLYAVLKKIETAYGMPMDVEFVVLGTTIYIVQARPAMHVPMKPSYISFEKVNEADSSLPLYGDIIVPGKSEVVIITNLNDIIPTKTLDQADQMPNSTTCKAVIVNEWASSLSHAAVNFKTYGTPCITVQDLSLVKKLIEEISVQKPLIIDVQQRCIMLWQNAQKNITDYIMQGWLEHPIDRTFSVWMDLIPVVSSSVNALPHDGKLIEFLEAFKKTTVSQQQKELLAKIVERVTKKLMLTQRRIQHLGSLIDTNIKEVFAVYKATFEELIATLTASIEQQADHFEILFYHKMLEALLYQKTDTQKVLGGYSHTYFLNELYDKQTLFMVRRKLGVTKLDFDAFF